MNPALAGVERNIRGVVGDRGDKGDGKGWK